METWKDIENYEGLYQISNKGRVRNSRSGRILIQKIKNTDSNSYRLIVLSKDNVKKCNSIHRLVAKAFLPNPNNLPCVNHKDENGENNIVENLEWCTHKYNTNYGTCIKRFSEKNKKPILQIKDGTVINEFSSAIEACEKYGFKRSCISECCRGRLKTYKCFQFKFKQ